MTKHVFCHLDTYFLLAIDWINLWFIFAGTTKVVRNPFIGWIEDQDWACYCDDIVSRYVWEKQEGSGTFRSWPSLLLSFHPIVFRMLVFVVQIAFDKMKLPHLSIQVKTKHRELNLWLILSLSRENKRWDKWCNRYSSTQKYNLLLSVYLNLQIHILVRFILTCTCTYW